MVVAITGGTGFIGSKLVARLVAAGVTVRLLTRGNSRPPEKSNLLEVHGCDLITSSDAELSAILEGVDVLYHCAGQITDPRLMRALHVDATQKLVRAAAGRISHWVQLSSVGVYGPVKVGAVSEDSKPNPIGEYEITKSESDEIVLGGASQCGFSYSVLRPSNVFGAGMTNQSLFSMINMIDRGLFCYIGQPGASANYIHVDNVVAGLISCGMQRTAKNRVYNLSDHCTLEHFVEVIASTLGRVAPRLRIPEPIAQLAGATLGKLPGFPLTQSRVDALANRSVYPITRIQHELDYHNILSMEDGLRELVEAYRQRFRIGKRR